jgi:hypothetical protein
LKMSEIEICPYLPGDVPDRPWRHGLERGEGFYMDALRFAQGYWVEGKPAQAILQLNKAFSADLRDGDEVLERWPWPYGALEWILERSGDGSRGFLGNPVRHFQHLATRMSGERMELRIARAWRCFYIARRVLGERGVYEMDGIQLVREGIFIPAERVVRSRLF